MTIFRVDCRRIPSRRASAAYECPAWWAAARASRYSSSASTRAAAAAVRRASGSGIGAGRYVEVGGEFPHLVGDFENVYVLSVPVGRAEIHGERFQVVQDPLDCLRWRVVVGGHAVPFCL